MNWSSGAEEATSTAQELPLRRPARPARCQVAAMVPGYPALTTVSSEPTSMPSSSALVETTPRIFPSRRAPSISRRSLKVAAAVAADGFRFSRKLRIRLLQIGEKNFRVQARIGEDDGLQIVFQKFLRDARGFIDVAAANAQRAIHDGRVVKHEGFFRGWCAVRMEDFDFGFEKTRGEVAGIGDGCRATNELRFAAVKSSDAPEAAQNIAQVAAEDAAVSVQFVEDDVAQIFEEASPARVVRQNSCVQHVRICKNEVALFANRTAGIGGRVAVVSENAEAILQTLVEVVKFRELILREGFCWEKIQRAPV